MFFLCSVEGYFNMELSTIIVALLSLLGTCVGSIAGVLTANKLTNYRIEQLEKKVDKQNSLFERVLTLELRVQEIEKYVKKIYEQTDN